MGCHSAPGLFCSLPVGLSCLLRAGALWDLSLPLLVQQWSFHSCSPGNPAGLTLTTALGQWESSHPVSLELDKAHGPFETHHSEYWSKRPAPGYGFMECQRSGVGTIPDIVPVSSSWHSIKQSLGQLFWGFHGHPLTEGICGVRLMPHLFSRTVHQQRNMGCVLPSLCYLLQLHFWLSHLPCMCLIGHNESWLWSNQTWFWRPKYCPRWDNPGHTNPRCEIREVLHQGFVKRRKQHLIVVCYQPGREQRSGCVPNTSLFSHMSPNGCGCDYSRGVILHC